ncbi:MAG: hypothetical protein BWY25_02249 [Chloroflexi bacterium ADurb.Bin222]|nr:MAG: hypothetical protein BWY25_02249 [Chloroflexi bacterium ADurb.Bin222]
MTYRATGEGRDHRRRHGDAPRRAIFGNGAFRQVHVNVGFVELFSVYVPGIGMGTQIRAGRLRRFLHDLAHLPGEREPALAGDEPHFDRQKIAAIRRPRQAHRYPHFIPLFEALVEVMRRAEVTFGGARSNPRERTLLLRQTAGRFATQAADLTLQVADAGLVGVAANQQMQRAIGETRRLRLQTVQLQLPGDQKAPRDFDFLFLGVAREFNDLHAVFQSGRNRVQDIRRGDEKHLREVIRNLQIVIRESVILLRVEHFEQRRRRVAAKVLPQLINLIQHEHGVHRAGAAHRLNDPSRQRADVGATMAADLRLVAHAAERDAHKLTA